MPAFPIDEPSRSLGRWAPAGADLSYQTISAVDPDEVQYGKLQAFGGTFGAIAIRPDEIGSVDTLVRVGVYSDAAGEPGAKLAEGSLLLQAAQHDGQLVDVPLEAPVALVGSQIVWLAFVVATATSAATFVSTSLLLPPFHDVRFEAGDGTLPAAATPQNTPGSMIYTALKE